MTRVCVSNEMAPIVWRTHNKQLRGDLRKNRARLITDLSAIPIMCSGAVMSEEQLLPQAAAPYRVQRLT